MVKPHRGDDRKERFRDVGGVPASSQPDLEHRHVHPFPGEVEKGHRRCELEIGQIDLGPPHLIHETGEAVVGHGISAAGDPLVEAMKVGRGEPALKKA